MRTVHPECQSVPVRVRTVQPRVSVRVRTVRVRTVQPVQSECHCQSEDSSTLSECPCQSEDSSRVSLSECPCQSEDSSTQSVTVRVRTVQPRVSLSE